jgi:ABC-2 type transport system permease protein
MTRRSHFYWSVRRELWEHRSIFWVPLAVAALAMASFLVGFARHVGGERGLEAMESAKRAATIALPYSAVASAVLLSSFIVALFYALDALHAERRDRTVLFWKSMPVSDTVTVLAKAFVPFAVAPAIAFVAALAAQLLMLAASAAILPILSDVRLGQMTVVMAYGVAIHALWFAPIYGYLLLVSAWANRAPIVWAVVPVFGLMAAENIALGTNFVGAVLRYRFMGAMTEGFAPNSLKGPITQLSQLEPAHFFASPNLWLGLVFAAAFIYAAVHLRRSRETN